MFVIMGMFLFNLMCGLVPCEPKFDPVPINLNPLPEIGFRDGRPVNKNDIPARVTVTEGKIEGYQMKTMGGRTIFAFEGIPYGSAERWKPAERRKPWQGTLQTKAPGSDCLQISLAKLLRVYGSESCLFLNLYTPDLPYEGSSPNYPVVVYIHGGSFVMGSGSEHGPAYMLDEDIILVTINYRLGVFGFLSTGDHVIPGNWGLKDQALAIEWIYENIARFGGDPKNINLWGYSAGAVSVHLHMISNKTRHMFTKGISGGGNALNHWGDWFPFPPTLFSPTIEPDHPEAFLIESPEDAYKFGHVAKKPWVLSTTREEGLTGVLVLELLLRWFPMRLSWNNVARHLLDFDYIADNPQDITDKVTKFYFGDKSPIKATVFDYSKSMTDRFFHVGINNGLKAHSQIAPTYSFLYSFSKGTYSLGNIYGHQSNEWGAGHGQDDAYFFNASSLYHGLRLTDPEYKISQVMINFLTNFVTKGEPLFITDAGEELKVWEPVRHGSDIRMLEIDEEIKMINMPNQERLQFWFGLGLKDTVPWISENNISSPVEHNMRFKFLENNSSTQASNV